LRNLEYFRCSCRGEVIQGEVDESLPFVDLAFFSYGGYYDERLSFKQKIRWCYNVFKTGHPYSDAVELPPEEAIRMGEWLKAQGKHLAEKHFTVLEPKEKGLYLNCYKDGRGVLHQTEALAKQYSMGITGNPMRSLDYIFKVEEINFEEYQKMRESQEWCGVLEEGTFHVLTGDYASPVFLYLCELDEGTFDLSLLSEKSDKESVFCKLSTIYQK